MRFSNLPMSQNSSLVTRWGWDLWRGPKSQFFSSSLRSSNWVKRQRVYAVVAGAGGRPGRLMTGKSRKKWCAPCWTEPWKKKGRKVTSPSLRQREVGEARNAVLMQLPSHTRQLQEQGRDVPQPTDESEFDEQLRQLPRAWGEAGLHW